MKKFYSELLNENNGGGDGSGAPGAGGEGEGQGQKVFSQSDLDAAVAAAVKTNNDKMSAKNSELLEELKGVKSNLRAFDGIDPEKTKQMLAAFENDQDLKDIAEGRHEDVFKRRTEKIEAGYKASMDNLANNLKEAETGRDFFKDKFESLSINRNAIDCFIKHGGLPTATEDVELRARKTWKLEGDDIVARDGTGELITGANGQISMDEWVVSLKKTSPHLFPQSQSNDPKGNTETGGKFSINDKLNQALKDGNQAEYQRLRREMRKR